MSCLLLHFAFKSVKCSLNNTENGFLMIHALFFHPGTACQAVSALVFLSLPLNMFLLSIAIYLQNFATLQPRRRPSTCSPRHKNPKSRTYSPLSGTHHARIVCQTWLPSVVYSCPFGYFRLTLPVSWKEFQEFIDPSVSLCTLVPRGSPQA
jgi:hypothetical protein